MALQQRAELYALSPRAQKERKRGGMAEGDKGAVLAFVGDRSPSFIIEESRLAQEAVIAAFPATVPEE